MSEKSCRSGLRILHKNEFGFIGKCPCCKEVQFRIGNVVSYMPEDGFFALYRSLKKIEDEFLPSKILTTLPNGEKILLRTPVDNFMLCLTTCEFVLVMDLFKQAELKLQLFESLEEVEKMN